MVLFTFPKTASNSQKWAELLFPGQQKNKTYVFVCLWHFTLDCFVNMGAHDAGLATRLLLKTAALPTILARDEESEARAVGHNVSLSHSLVFV